MSNRESLAMPRFDGGSDGMDDFAPRRAPRAPEPAGQGGQAAPAPEPAPRRTPGTARDRRAVDAVSRFPSREGPADAQLNLKGPREVLERFKAMCKDDRRSYYDMLRILMDNFEGRAR